MAKVKTSKQHKNHAYLEKIHKATIGSGEPILTVENYGVDIIKAFTYYHNYVDSKNKRKWVSKYLGKDKDIQRALDKVSDYELTHVAVLIRLIDTGQIVQEKETKWLEARLEKLLTKAKTKEDKPDVEKVAKPSIQDRIKAIANGHIGELEARVDEFVDKKKSTFNMADYISANNINPPTAKHIAAWCNDLISEVDEAMLAKDEDLVEGYSYFSKPQLKKFNLFLKGIVEACVQRKVKVVRVRKVKVKPASDIVKRVKYKAVDDEFGLKSIHPTKLVNSSEVWFFNTKSRRMTVLRAVDGDVLIVKGTTILNFDTVKSEIRTLRKPEEFLKTKISKRDLAAAFKDLTTKAAKPNGRLNAECVIMGVF